MNETHQQIHDAILIGDSIVVKEGVRFAVKEMIPAGEILNTALIPAMVIVGELYESGDYFVPEMLIAARAMQSGLDILRPLLTEAGVESSGKVIIGSVKGDLHDIGKNLVGMLLEGAGFEIIDLGTDVGPEKFIETARSGVDIIGLSALLTTTMPAMQSTIQAFEDAGLRDQVKIIIGGAPVTEEYAAKIGADGFAPDASNAVKLAKSLIS